MQYHSPFGNPAGQNTGASEAAALLPCGFPPGRNKRGLKRMFVRSRGRSLVLLRRISSKLGSKRTGPGFATFSSDAGCSHYWSQALPKTAEGVCSALGGLKAPGVAAQSGQKLGCWLRCCCRMRPAVVTPPIACRANKPMRAIDARISQGKRGVCRKCRPESGDKPRQGH